MIPGIVVGVIVVILAIALWVLYNGLVRLRNQVKNAWAQIDVQLKRRYDLIPNLMETVKGYMKHERETLEALRQEYGRTTLRKARAYALLSMRGGRLLLADDRPATA